MKTAYRPIMTIVLVGLLTLLAFISVAIAQGVPDLVVTTIEAPGFASTQQQIEVSWTVESQGVGFVRKMQILSC